MIASTLAWLLLAESSALIFLIQWPLANPVGNPRFKMPQMLFSC
jgi:hypothetical protein